VIPALGTVLGWLGVAERVERLVERVWPKAAPEPESPPLTHKDVEHIQEQIRSGARRYPPPTPAPPRPSSEFEPVVIPRGPPPPRRTR
jgi:hypothetical protein